MKSLHILSSLALIGLLVFTTGCGRANTHNKGSAKRQSKKNLPPGTLYIQGGTFLMGSGEKELEMQLSEHHRTVTVGSFHMDEEEVSNISWKEFLYAIKEDSGDAKWRTLYPDTTVWLMDLAYNEPYVNIYYSHPSFNEYPVVGVNWHQANEYCKWRTQAVHKYRKIDSLEWAFRLPTEAEWEFAARGLQEEGKYVWEGRSMRNQGKGRANSKGGRGDYGGWAGGDGRKMQDAYTTTAPCKSYVPNDYGLYNMAGNAAEWVLDDFVVLIHEKGSYYTDTIPTRSAQPWSPDPGLLPFQQMSVRKVYRGGSWKDQSFYLKPGTRRYMNADSAKATVGFRCVVSAG